MKDANRSKSPGSPPGHQSGEAAAEVRGESRDPRIERLEEKISHLERHVVAQDKAMLEMADEVAALRRQVNLVRETAADRRHVPADEAAELPDERPPHY